MNLASIIVKIVALGGDKQNNPLLMDLTLTNNALFYIF